MGLKEGENREVGCSMFLFFFVFFLHDTFCRSCLRDVVNGVGMDTFDSNLFILSRQVVRPL